MLVKYSLFNTYIATLALSSYPSLQSSNRLSSLHGLTTKRGKRRLNTQKWVWLVGPVWSLWSAWFDSLTMAFAHRGVCITYGDPTTELVSRALSWLTLGQTYNSYNLAAYPSSRVNFNNGPYSPRPDRAFAVIAGAPRHFRSHGVPTFSLSGSNVRHRVGWAVLPGPLNNKNLSRFILMAALVAYATSKGRLAQDGINNPYILYLRSAQPSPMLG